jgi:catechol 2,3-dioxygenase-like lactoylglutathione lyase family enzyme
MRSVPIFRVTDMTSALAFYSGILGFRMLYPGSPGTAAVVGIALEDAEVQLTILEGDQKTGVAANILVEDVDSLYEQFLERGLDTSGKEDSPVHQAPVDQTWGTRDFYVTDADGNTLRFCQRK